MEWTDLDQAYLEIFGEHPNVTWTPCPPVRPFEADLDTSVPRRPADEDAADGDGEMGDDE